MDFDFKEHNPDFERVVEIYNAWGSSECTKKEGNPFPIKGPGTKTVSESAEGSVQKALQKNCRFGFVAGGLDDRGCYLDFFDSGQEQYSPGLTAIVASEHTRSSMAEALYNRSCYATSGPRMVVGLEIAGVKMGQETDSGDKPGLMMNRHIVGYAAGTTTLKTVEIVRNGEVIETYKPKEYHFQFTYDDLTPLKDVVIDNKDGKPPFAYYYLRVTQEDGHVAWGSPIWVDLVPPKPSAKKAAKIAPKPVKKVEEVIEDDDDFDDDYDDE